jgi:hypothetical protein
MRPFAVKFTEAVKRWRAAHGVEPGVALRRPISEAAMRKVEAQAV